MRLFGLLYAAAAIAMTVFGHHHTDPLPWALVCAAAALLAGGAAVARPLVLPSAAHAGLTATWAGTVAAQHVKGVDSAELGRLAMLLFLCAGMGVIVALGLKSAPRAAARTSPQQ